MFNFAPPEISFEAICPILAVALTGLIALIVEMLAPKRDNVVLVAVSIAGLALAGLFAFIGITDPPFETAAEMVTHDVLSSVMQILLIGCAAITILFSESYLKQKRVPFGEFYPLVLWSTTGAMIMASTTNLLMVFVGLEILSISLYVMAGVSRSEEKSEESAMKYFLLGAFASGFLLYGIAFTYGATGTLSLSDIGMIWLKNAGESHVLLCCGLGLMIVGLSFKAGLVPFHQWTPDVYQGAPTNVTAFLATASKIAAFAALWRVVEGFQILSFLWLPVLGVIAVLTMLIGNVLALAQKDVKRVLGYSSIANSGYALVAIIAHGKAPNLVGVGTLCYYLMSYSFMTIGAFAIVSMCAKDGKEATSFEDLAGMSKRSPVAAGFLVLFMLSLIGIPPLAGFFGKALIFSDALKANLTWLAIVLAVSSVISVAYYLRIALAAFASDGERQESRLAPFGGSLAVATGICVVGVVAITIFYAEVMSALQLNPLPGQVVAMRDRNER